MLYRKIKSPNEIFQFVVPDSLKRIILDSLHSVGHHGRDRMLEVLKSRCYWVGITWDVEGYCKRCKRCNIAKPPHVQIRWPSGNQLASKPFEVVALDFTLLEKDSRGYENVLVITVVFTKFTIAVPTRDQKSSIVARALVEQWFFVFLCSSEITCGSR